MQPLKKVQSVLTFIGICAWDDSISLCTILIRDTICAIVTVMHLINATATMLYFFKYIADDYDGGIYGLLAAIVLICGFWTLVTMSSFRNELLDAFNVFDDLEQQYGHRKGYFEDDTLAVRTGRKMCKFFIDFYGPAYFCTVISLSIINYTSCYMQNTLDRTCLMIPYYYVLPWSQDTVEGWAITIIYSICFAGCYFALNAWFLTAFVTICLQFDTLRLHFESILLRLDNRLLNMPGSDLQIKSILVECMQFHIRVRDVFLSLTDVFRGTIFVQIIGGVLFMSTSIFTADVAVRNPNIYSIAGLNVLFTSTANLYLYCYGGDVATSNYQIYATSLFETDWYRVRNPMQKFFIIMIAEMQKPLYFDGYRMFKVSLESFTKMLRTVMSYYMLFRTLAVE